MKTNQEKAAESKIKLGNKYIQILKDNFENWKSEFTTDFLVDFSLSRSDFNMGFKVYTFDGVRHYDLYFDSVRLRFSSDGKNDSYNDYPGIESLITNLEEQAKIIRYNEQEKYALENLLNQEKALSELNVLFPDDR